MEKFKQDRAKREEKDNHIATGICISFCEKKKNPQKNLQSST